MYLLAFVLLGGFAVAGCGGSSARPLRADAAGGATASSSSSPASVASPAAAAAHLRAEESEHYLNDGDKEREGDADGDNTADNDKDPSLDYLPSDQRPHENSRYHDTDDKDLVTSGYEAGAAEEQAVAAVVDRYYAAATAGDGAEACSLLLPSLASAVPTDYGQAPGPAYLRGGKTCAAVMALLFKYNRRQLAGRAKVTGVRIENGQTLALLGSTTLPATATIVQSEGGKWKIAQLLATENSVP